MWVDLMWKVEDSTRRQCCTVRQAQAYLHRSMGSLVLPTPNCVTWRKLLNLPVSISVDLKSLPKEVLCLAECFMHSMYLTNICFGPLYSFNFLDSHGNPDVLYHYLISLFWKLQTNLLPFVSCLRFFLHTLFRITILNEYLHTQYPYTIICGSSLFLGN